MPVVTEYVYRDGVMTMLPMQDSALHPGFRVDPDAPASEWLERHSEALDWLWDCGSPAPGTPRAVAYRLDMGDAPRKWGVCVITWSNSHQDMVFVPSGTAMLDLRMRLGQVLLPYELQVTLEQAAISLSQVLHDHT